MLEALTPYLHSDDVDKDYVQGYQYEAYFQYAREKKPKSILEIGVSRGYSILSMCLGHLPARVMLIDSMYDGIDPFTAASLVRGLGVRDVRALVMDSKDAIEQIEQEYDIIHIDGEHTAHGLKADLEYLEFLAPDGWIIVDDVGDMNELWQVCEAFAEWKGLSIQKVDTFRGHAILRKP